MAVRRPPQSAVQKASALTQPLTLRSVVIGLALVPLNAWWLAHIEYVRYSDNATTSALFFNCIAALLILIGINRLLSRIAPRWRLSRAEILTIYIILVLSSALAGHDQLQILFTTVTWVFRNATPENSWAEELHPYIPRHLVVSAPAVLERLYLGGSTLYRMDNVLPWLQPVAWWFLFTVALVGTMLCLAAIFRRQWDNERLNYPIADPPLEATSPRSELFSSRLFWIAFAIAAFMQLWRLANNLWPAIPPLHIGVHNYRFRALPWSAMGTIPLSSYPFSYGMAYLMPLQLAQSVWIFFWLARLEMAAAAVLGYFRWRGFPYIQQQSVGAYFGIAAFVLWAARGHLAEFLRAAVSTQISSRLRGDAMAPPLALWGLIAGFGALVGFSCAAGMRPISAIVFFALFFPIVLTLARLRAELGLPTIELYQVGPDDIMQNIAGTRAWSKRDPAVMTLYFWLVRTHRQLPMPAQMDCLRIGHQSKMPLGPLTGVMFAASALTVLAAFWAYLHVMYQVGYESAKFTGPAKWAFGWDPWRKLDAWYANPRQPQYGATAAYLFGFGFTMFLAAMRTRFLWWPLHPVGYLVAGSFGLFRLWLPIFITWLVKSVLLRYGGLSAYRRARPFFIGLIFGEFSAAFLRTVLDLVFDLHLPARSGVGGL